MLGLDRVKPTGLLLPFELAVGGVGESPQRWNLS